MGGTFMSLPADYRDYFVRSLHDALSGAHSANVAQAVKYTVVWTYLIVLLTNDQQRLCSITLSVLLQVF